MRLFVREGPGAVGMVLIPTPPPRPEAPQPWLSSAAVLTTVPATMPSAVNFTLTQEMNRRPGRVRTDRHATGCTASQQRRRNDQLRSVANANRRQQSLRERQPEINRHQTFCVLDAVKPGVYNILALTRRFVVPGAK